MTTPTIEQLHTLADRAERGRLTPAETAVLRAGLTALAAARRSAGGAQTAIQAAQAAQRQAEAERDHARRWAVALENELAEARAALDGATPPDEGVQCWHIEPGTPCDWNICRQPERLATGDRGTDPADASPNAATGPHNAPHTPRGTGDHPSPERPTRARTDARTHTEG